MKRYYEFIVVVSVPKGQTINDIYKKMLDDKLSYYRCHSSIQGSKVVFETKYEGHDKINADDRLREYLEGLGYSVDLITSISEVTLEESIS